MRLYVADSATPHMRVSTRSIGMVTGFQTVHTDILPVASNNNFFTLILHVPLSMLLVRMGNLKNPTKSC